MILGMNILYFTLALLLASFIVFITMWLGKIAYTINLKHLYAENSDEIDEKVISKNRTLGRCVIVCFIIMMLCLTATISVAIYYNNHGAFYDNAWRDPTVDSHFTFDTKDTNYLQNVYNSDPENFKPELYNVILVRLGCSDCEDVEQILLSAKDEGEIYIIFSRSEIGQIYVNKYNIEYVPSTVLDGVYIPLYDEETINNIK